MTDDIRRAVESEREAWHAALCDIARQYEREAAYHAPNDAMELATLADAIVEAADRVLVMRTPIDELRSRLESQGIDIDDMTSRIRTKVNDALRAQRPHHPPPRPGEPGSSRGDR